jgi:hypothetical protein
MPRQETSGIKIMETWYKVGKYRYRNERQIMPVDVIKSTAKKILIKHHGRENLVNKISSYDNYFETYDEAYHFLKQRKEGLVQSLTEKLEVAEKDLEDYNDTDTEEGIWTDV